MQVPDSIRRCSAFLGYRTAALGEQFAGTAFFVAETKWDAEKRTTEILSRWAVTARHVLGEMKTHSVDTATLLRVNGPDGARWVEFEHSDWVGHPDDARDTAVLRLGDQLDDTDALFFPAGRIADQETIDRWNIGVGDEVLITGLFRHTANTARNIPIVRIGFVAAMPDEPVAAGAGMTPAYLIEARSIGGLSGSPAFLNYGAIRMNPQTRRFQQLSRPEFSLLGVVHGHFKVDAGAASLDAASAEAGGLTVEETNSGIAIVIPAWSITEAIAHAKAVGEQNG